MKLNELFSSEHPLFWTIFKDIFTTTYRESKHEELIRERLKNYYLELSNKNDFLKNSRLLEDKTGNILIKIPSNREKFSDNIDKLEEHKTPLMLQAHLDMVCEKNADIDFDFKTQPLNLEIIEDDKGKWLTAKGTTLGADNGIGASMLLSLITDLSEIPHGDLEFLFTIDEETGLTGALELDVNALKINSRNLINVDSEEFGNITIGSAGGGGVYIFSKFIPTELKEKNLYEIKVSGLKGGHSGADIHLPRANGNAVISSILSSLIKELKVQIISWNGGNKTNAIPRESSCKIALNDIKTDINNLFSEIRERFYTYYKYPGYEPEMNIEFKPLSQFSENDENNELVALSDEDTKKVIYFTHLIPHGYIKFSPEIENLVETSQNFAVINLNSSNSNQNKERTFEIKLSVRSSVDSELEEQRSKMVELAEIYSFNAELSKSYPGWNPDPTSPFLKFVKEIYNKHCRDNNIPLSVGAIHAGLETGFIGAKIEGIQMVSIGPTIIHPHSPDESVNIRDAELFYKVLMDIIRKY